MAKAIGGCSQAFISEIEMGRSGPSATLVAGLERLGYSGNWLMTGEGEMKPAGGSVVARDAPGLLYGLRQLPLVGKVAAGLGQCIPADEVERLVPVFLGEHVDHECFVSRVTGKSMEPMFRSGDLIVIDKTCPVQNDDVAVVVVDDQVMLKRVSMDDHTVYLLSINSHVAPILVRRDSDSARIVGKVIQLIRASF